MTPKRERHWILNVATFLAIVVLQSIPRFTFEINQATLLGARLILLALFFLVAWFFTIGMHEKFNWNVITNLFTVEAGIAVALGISLFLQLYSPMFIYLSFVVLGARAFIYSYLVSYRLNHLRSLVFGACAFLMVIGEIILINASIS